MDSSNESFDSFVTEAFQIALAANTLDQFQKSVITNLDVLEKNGISKGSIKNINELRYVQSAVLTLMDGECILLEQFISTNKFMKFSSNDQTVNEKSLEIYNSLSHFSAWSSDNDFVLTDIQGSMSVLTDPQFHFKKLNSS